MILFFDTVRVNNVNMLLVKNIHDSDHDSDSDSIRHICSVKAMAFCFSSFTFVLF